MNETWYVANKTTQFVFDHLVTMGLTQFPKENQIRVLDPAGFNHVSLLLELYDFASCQFDSVGFSLAKASTKEFSLPGYIAMNSPTLRSACQNANRYYQLMTNINQLNLIISPHQAGLIFNYAPLCANIPPAVIEGSLATAFSIIKLATSHLIEPCILKVSFTYSAPANLDEYLQFFGVELEFNALNNAIWFNKDFLDQPLQESEPGICHYLSQHADTLLRHLPDQDPWLNSFQNTLKNQLELGEFSLANIASRMGLGNKTLQRRLRQRNTNFKDQLDQLRMQLAKQYLNQSVPLIEISFLLGYSEQSAFHRAFKKWYQCTPKEYRQLASK